MKFSTALAGFLLVAVQAVNADVVYQQPSVWTAGSNVGVAWTSQINSAGSGFRTYDNFQLGSAATVVHASWRGTYLNGDLTGGAPNTSTWSIGFYGDSAGAPGALLSNNTLTSAQVTSQSLGAGFFGANPVTVFQFDADLTNFNASAGTQYWFSPESQATNFAPFFTWIQGTGGDNASFQEHLSSGSVDVTYVRSTDRAFTLYSTPEPSAVSLLVGVVLATIPALRRRLKN